MIEHQLIIFCKSHCRYRYLASYNSFWEEFFPANWIVVRQVRRIDGNAFNSIWVRRQCLRRPMPCGAGSSTPKSFQTICFERVSMLVTIDCRMRVWACFDACFDASKVLKRARQHYCYSGIHILKNESWIFMVCVELFWRELDNL